MKRNTKAIWGFFLLCVALPVAVWAAPDIPIADFEGKDYGDWKVEGEAFGARPARGTLPGQMHVSGFKGKGLVNSFFKGDDVTGVLTSPPFVIERDFINFLIGGGGYASETCMDLLVDGQPARTATGPNVVPGGSEQLAWASWDVSDLKGKTAQIRIVDNRTGSWGHINVDQIHQSGRSLVLPDLEKTMKIEKQYLNLPVKDGADMRRLNVLVDSQVARYLDIELADGAPDYWAFMDVSEFKGKDVTLRVNQPPDSSPSALDAVTQDDAISGADGLYDEKLRPQFHFTSRRGWNNDPNGAVFYDGEYHLFYQHNPYGWKWGNMHWGQAVSTDLVHWTELSDAICPDALGTIFSGSAVVDASNTAGFQTGSEKVIVCIYTSAGSLAPKPVPFTQSIAYSNDRGRTFTKFDGNPVLGHIAGDNRDPKAIWHAPTERWVMALYLDKNTYALFNSPDLKTWTRLCDVEVPGCSECPDIFELPVDGDEAKKKFVFWGANGAYAVGTFDGTAFAQEGEARQLYAGGNAYAAQSWSNVPESDGRRIQIAWLRQELPGMPFNQMMSFPVVLTLRTADDGIRMFAEPVREIESLHGKQHHWQDETVSPDSNLLRDVAGDLLHIRASFAAEGEFGFDVRGVPVVYNAAKQELTCGGKTVPMTPENGAVDIEILVDRASIEVFGNRGRIYWPEGMLFPEENNAVKLVARGQAARIQTLDVWELNSAWK